MPMRGSGIVEATLESPGGYLGISFASFLVRIRARAWFSFPLMLRHQPTLNRLVAGAFVRCGRRVALLLALLATSSADAAPSPLVIDGLSVDGREQPLPIATSSDPPRLRLSPGPHQMNFRFGPPDDQGPPLRLRYRLEGFDKTWREAGGEMRLTLMMFNAAGEVLGLFETPMRGESEGWSNTVAQSRFTARQEVVDLPPDAESLRIIFNSGTWDTRDGASHPTVGVALIDDCRMWLTNSTGEARNIWPNPTFDEGEELDQPDGHPSGWTRGGMGPKIARVLTLPNHQGHVLALEDDNPRNGAEWRGELALPDRPKSGSQLTVEWKELFTVGAAGGQSASYPYLPPGDYVFHVVAVSPTGQPTGHEAALAISIPQVFWKTATFLTLSGAGCVVVVAGAARGFTRRRMQRQFERLEQQRALERERARIARDIHDDLGTSLTQVALLSQSVRGAVAPGSPAAEELEQINRTSQEMTRTLDEIVWAVDPAHDSLDSIANYLGRFAQDFLSTAGISCRLDLPVQLPAKPIAAEVRHNLFLAFKEALNNVVRHSGAREVNITLRVEARRFVLSVGDDGHGFDPAAPPAGTPPRQGHGLANLRTRLQQIGGAVEIASQPGRGAMVQLLVPLPEEPARGS